MEKGESALNEDCSKYKVHMYVHAHTYAVCMCHTHTHTHIHISHQQEEAHHPFLRRPILTVKRNGGSRESCRGTADTRDRTTVVPHHLLWSPALDGEV